MCFFIRNLNRLIIVNLSPALWERDHLRTWCGQINWKLNVLKTVEMLVDFRTSPLPPAPHQCMWLPSEQCAFLVLPGHQNHLGPTMVHVNSDVLLYCLFAASTAKDKSRLQYVIYSSKRLDWLQCAIAPGSAQLQDPKGQRKDYVWHLTLFESFPLTTGCAPSDMYI